MDSSRAASPASGVASVRELTAFSVKDSMAFRAFFVPNVRPSSWRREVACSFDQPEYTYEGRLREHTVCGGVSCSSTLS